MPKWLLKQKSSSSDSYNAISGLYWTAEPRGPCDILVANVGPEVAKTAKTVKLLINCQKCVQSQKCPKWLKQHF